LEDVLNRAKIKKYIHIPVSELIDFHRGLCIFHKTKPIYIGSPDPKDNFLFDLATQTHSKYVVTGDKIMLKQKSPAFKFITKLQFERLVK
jgi:predicted nucleic acid-binding protein